MRVVHVSAYFAPAFCYGGPPRSVLGLCRGLQQAGVHVEVITTTANGAADIAASPPEGDTYDGVPVRYLRRAFPKRFFGARLRAPLRAALARADICHVHGLWNVPEWTATRLAREMGVPYVLSPRGMLHPAARRVNGVRKKVAWRLFEQSAVAAAARLHATSEEEADLLATFVDRRRVVLVPNGVEAQSVATAQGTDRFNLPQGAFVVTFIGRLHRIKRLDLLVDAFARVQAVHREARLVIAGPDEQRCLASMAPLLARLGDAVRYVGPVDDGDKWRLLGKSSALVLCSDSENFGLSVVEAMAAGVPVVVTRTCPWPDIERGRCGFWVEHTPQAIAAALIDLAERPDCARAMGERGARLARDKYSWNAIGEALAGCYERVIAEQPR